MFKIKIPLVLRRALERKFHESRIFRMNPLENKFHDRCRRSVVLEDPKGLFRPVDLAGGRSPAEAARMAYSLCFGQIGLALLQLPFLQFQSAESEAFVQPRRHQSQS